MKKWMLMALGAAWLCSGCGSTWNYNAPEDDDWESKPFAAAHPSTYQGDEPPTILLGMQCQPDTHWKEMVAEYGVYDEFQDGHKNYKGQEVEVKATVMAEETFPITRVDGKAIFFEIPVKSRFAMGTFSEAGAMSIDYPVYIEGEGWERRYVKLHTKGIAKALKKAEKECKEKYPGYRKGVREKSE